MTQGGLSLRWITAWTLLFSSSIVSKVRFSLATSAIFYFCIFFAALYFAYFEQFDETVKPTPLVNGRDLMQQLDLEPGPEIGRLLRLIEEKQAVGEITTRVEALQFARGQVS